MSGISTVIQSSFLIGAGASSTVYIGAANLPNLILGVQSTVNLQIDMFDGFGNTSTPLVTEPVPHSLDVAPAGVVFSTGGKTYLSKPKVGGTSMTSIAVLVDRCGPWIKVVLGNQEGVQGSITIQGSVA